MPNAAKRRGVLVILSLVVASTLAFPSLWRTFVVEPAAFVLWAVWRVLLSVDQNFYWMLVVLLSVIPLFRLLREKERSDVQSAYPSDFQPVSRLDHWRSIIKDSNLARDAFNELEEDLQELSWAINEVDEPGSVAAASMIMVNDHPRSSQDGNSRRGWPDIAPQALHDFREHAPTVNLPPFLRRALGWVVQEDYSWINQTLEWMETELGIHNGKE